jgi:hypothetical protein
MNPSRGESEVQSIVNPDPAFSSQDNPWIAFCVGVTLITDLLVSLTISGWPTTPEKKAQICHLHPKKSALTGFDATSCIMSAPVSVHTYKSGSCKLIKPWCSIQADQPISTHRVSPWRSSNAKEELETM